MQYGGCVRSNLCGSKSERKTALVQTARRTIDASDNPAVLGGVRAKNNGRYNGNGREWITPPEVFDPLHAEPQRWSGAGLRSAVSWTKPAPSISTLSANPTKARHV
jgi:hypothetical protein